MHKLTLTLVAGAVGALAGSAATRTEAGLLSGAEGIRIASEDVSAIQNVLYGRRVYRRAAVYRAPVRRAVAIGTAATVAGAAAYPYAYGSSYPYAYGYSSYPYSYGYAPGYSSYGYAPGYSSYGYAPGYSSYGYAPGYSSYGYAPGVGIGVGVARPLGWGVGYRGWNGWGPRATFGFGW
jgi:hypothetical protein